MLLNLVLWVLLGAVAGWIASKIMGGENTLGINILLGIIGAVVGGFVANALGIRYDAGFSIESLLVAIVGAIIVILIVRLLRRAT
ncbi:MAG TPA: GlsB/YeaQ/YmgE family stress response membrane protein [Candidatus Syntrophosphaera sp.]|nr:GlsB/YeaQ/YmgE family stress response membrane protein [Candidatus Syntrophosphaera sp.]